MYKPCFPEAVCQIASIQKAGVRIGAALKPRSSTIHWAPFRTQVHFKAA
jgi:hypothetical protein